MAVSPSPRQETAQETTNTAAQSKFVNDMFFPKHSSRLEVLGGCSLSLLNREFSCSASGLSSAFTGPNCCILNVLVAVMELST